MNYFFLIAGISILLLVYLDFFYTTLSCNGSGKLTATVNTFLGKIWHTGRQNEFNNWVGLLHLIFVVFLWILLLLGSFLVFISFPDLVLNASSQTPASNIERLYYTLYIFSTLGNGDFMPGSTFSQIFTGLLSIGGFVLLTTGITYLLSVTSTALEKKKLAGFIFHMGKNPIELYGYFNINGDAQQFLKRANELAKLIQEHSDDHLSFPIVHYFLTTKKEEAVAVQLVSLYESLQMIKINFRNNTEIITEAMRVESTLGSYLEMTNISYVRHKEDLSVVLTLRKKWEEHGYAPFITNNVIFEEKFTALLASQGWSWKDVYR